MIAPDSTISHIFYVRLNGAVIAPSATPTGTIVRDGVDTAVPVTVLSRSDGGWLAQATIPANWTAGQHVALGVSAGVAGYADPAVETFELGVVGGVVDEDAIATAVVNDLIASNIEINLGSTLSASGDIELVKNETLTVRFTDRDIPTDTTKIYFTASTNLRDDDSEAIVQIESGVGLKRLNGQDAATAGAAAGDGSVNFDQPSGTCDVVLEHGAIALIESKTVLHYDLKALTSTGKSKRLAKGLVVVTWTPTKVV